MKIFILHTRKAETAPLFARTLENCEAGNSLPSNHREYFIINYGTRLLDAVHAKLNKNLITEKFKALSILKEAGINVPQFWWIPTARVSIVDLLNWVKRLRFPLLARRTRHFKGKDIIFLRSRFSLRKRLRRVLKRQTLVEYIPKQLEFRVHVLGDEAPIISQKVPSENSRRPHPHVWTSDRGWTLVDYEGIHTEALKQLGIKTLKALHYDFGAIDIGLSRNNQFFVFEVNSAPRLSKQRRKIYAQYFRQKEKAFRRTNQ